MSGLGAEAVLQFRLALPVASANLLQRLSTWVTWAAVGHLGADYLGPVTLASSVNNVLGTSVVGGLAIGVSTLASQAHGAQDAVALSRVLQRAIVVGLLGSLPCVAVLLAMKPLLLILHMGEEFTHRAASYAMCVLLVTPCMGVQRSVRIWLVSQNITTPPLVIQLVAVPVHVALTLALTFGTPLHYVGAGVAMTVSTLAQVAMMYGYILLAPRCARTWKGFSREAFRELRPYLRMALPGVLMNAEYWVGETLTFAAGELPDPDACLSALAIYQLAQTTCYQVPSAIRTAISTRIGNLLGAGEASHARAAQRAGLWLVCLWIVFPTLLFLVFTRQWGLIFTDSEPVLRLLGKMVYCMLIYSDTDALLAYYNGVLASCGQQGGSGRWAIRAYVLVGFPLALAMAFPLKLGTLGLVVGHTVGKVCHTLPCMVLSRRIDWRLEGQRAVERVQCLSADGSQVPLVPRS